MKDKNHPIMDFPKRVKKEGSPNEKNQKVIDLVFFAHALNRSQSHRCSSTHKLMQLFFKVPCMDVSHLQQQINIVFVFVLHARTHDTPVLKSSPSIKNVLWDFCRTKYA